MNYSLSDSSSDIVLYQSRSRITEKKLKDKITPRSPNDSQQEINGSLVDKLRKGVRVF